MRICHFTSLHNRYDTRVFVKQCCSLAKSGHEVFLIVADGKKDEQINGVTIIDVGFRGGIKNRFLKINQQIFEKALVLNAACYFYHDPELCIQGIKLIKAGKKVIYDAHEDSPRQYVANAKSNTFKSGIIAKGIELLENRAAKQLSGIMTATEGIKERYDLFNRNVKVVRNYPIIEELGNNANWIDRSNEGCYIGGLRNTRGISEIVEACAQTNFPLKLAGPWQPQSYQEEISKKEAWSNTSYLGFLNRNEIKNLLSNSKIGFLTLYKTPNHMHSLPVKLFEYMLAGIPVIASDIPVWKQIIEKYNCGICVDPHDIEAIKKAVIRLTENPEDAKKMGANGKQAILDEFSWEVEFETIKNYFLER